MTHHTRQSWNAKAPRGGQRRLNPAKVEGVVIHYNGPAVPAAAQRNPREFLRGIQRFHQNTRGWSDVAYNFAVDANGDIWELRGLTARSAANGNTLTNSRWLAVLAIIGEGQTPTPLMLEGLRHIIDYIQGHYPRADKIIGHRDLRQTSCPGDILYRHVKMGTFAPRRASAAPPPTQEEDSMAVIFENEKQFISAVQRAVAGIQVGRQRTDGKPLTWGIVEQRLYNGLNELLAITGDLTRLVAHEGMDPTERKRLVEDIAKRIAAQKAAD